MPRLTESVKTKNFDFSHVALQDLTETEYTLCELVIDISRSVIGYERDIERMVGDIIVGLQKAPRKNNLLIRVSTFNDRVHEVHGYKLLTQITPVDYAYVIKPCGTTALIDALFASHDAIANFGKALSDKHYTANGIIVLMTDGQENSSTLSYDDLSKTIEQARRTEVLESCQSVCVYFNETSAASQSDINNLRNAGIDNFIEAGNMSAETFAKVTKFTVSSVSSSSQALGTGGPSQLLTF